MRTSTTRQQLRHARFLQRAGFAFALAVPAIVLGNAAGAEQIANQLAVFNGLDKITGRIVSFEVAINETVQFGSLQLTPRACYTRPPTEAPNTTAFIEVDEISAESGAERLFTGWVFAASPGLHGIEHPVYDIWLTDCQGGTAVAANAKTTPASSTDSTANANPGISVGDIDPNAPPLPPSRPAFDPPVDMRMEMEPEPLPSPYERGILEDPLFAPIGD